MLNKKCSVLLMLLASLSLSGCTWVKVSAEGENVKVYTSAQAQKCERIGVTTAQVKHEVAYIKRRQNKVETELQTLARNQAAVMGGDAIVSEADMDEGKQQFVVYRCP